MCEYNLYKNIKHVSFYIYQLIQLLIFIKLQIQLTNLSTINYNLIHYLPSANLSAISYKLVFPK